MDMTYFNYCQGLTMTSPKFDELFGGPPREPEAPLTQREMDLAASIQGVTEEIMLRMARHVHAADGHEEPLPGRRRGAQLRRQRPHPARRAVREHLDSAGRGRRRRGARRGAASSGTSCSDQPRSRRAPRDRQHGSLLGPGFIDAEIRDVPRRRRRRRIARFDDDDALCDAVADLLADEKVVGWFQGRMEFGPRALGARSILGEPRSPAMQSVMNLKIKFRESFRPFAPSVLRRARRRVLRDAAAANRARTCCWSRRCSERSALASNGQERRSRASTS